MKKKLIISLSSLIIVLSILVTLSFIKANAANNQFHEHKYYLTIQINYGDTLTSIADRYITEEYESRSEYIKELKKINNLGDSNIKSGDYLVVPYYSDEEL